MTEQEAALYKRIRDVPVNKAFEAATKAMHARSEARFRAYNAALKKSTEQVEPTHSAIREIFANNPAFASVAKALQARRAKPYIDQLPPLKVPPTPKVARLKLGSVHLVDVPPFQSQTWSACQFSGGNESVSDDVTSLGADGNGNMSFNISGGGQSFDNASSVSCWAAVGGAYTMPPGLGKEETNGAWLRFSANPSFNWTAAWGSWWYRLASGNIWIGQVVNRFDANWVYIDDPVWTQINLVSWNDYNLADNSSQTGENAGFGLTSWLFVEPQVNYFAWVWIGASAFGDWVDSGSSGSNATMNANCSQLILDSF
jgi:hypothetical protein